MPQSLKRFEQDCSQRPVLPGGTLNYDLQQAPLFRRRLLKEQFARPTCWYQQVNGMINGRGRCILDFSDLFLNRLLFAAPHGGLVVEKLLLNAAIELVKIHRLNTRFYLFDSDLQSSDGLFTSSLFGPVRFDHGVSKPFEDGLGNSKLSKNLGELGLRKPNRD
jgi:hypothetical protein